MQECAPLVLRPPAWQDGNDGTTGTLCSAPPASHRRPQQPSREWQCLYLAKQLPLRGRDGSPVGWHGLQYRARGSLHTLRVPVYPVSTSHPQGGPWGHPCCPQPQRGITPPSEQLAWKGEEGKSCARLMLISASAL